ncbi:hypothetical protein CDAR_197981 [Caerostris darwini]|uniref:C2H2-type domain-containing protein n=1 Tax=Caerostris darwini TaxID=1538125 RepID=A0AAV4SJV6_9ARAC|nr:hypothetical protein CDAR_197981 [Caerostris darwini]
MKAYNVSNEAPSQKRNIKGRSKQQEKQTSVVQEKHNTIVKEINLECDLCKMQFPNDISLKKHYSSHKKVGLICHICSRAFFFKHEFKKHVKAHSKHKPFGCGLHQQPFSVENILKLDSKTSHTDNKG